MKLATRTLGPWLLIFTAVGCKSQLVKSTRTSSAQPQPPPNYQPAQARPVVIAGENCCARSAADGQTFAFLSRQRPRHSQWQVYLYNLEAKREFRLSYHDGNDHSPALSFDGQWVYYASTTDEDKEFPELFKNRKGEVTAKNDRQNLNLNLGYKPAWTNSPFEIYRSRLDGSEIERLTHSPGFDGELRLHPKSNSFVFVSTRDRHRPQVQFSENSGVSAMPLGGDATTRDGEPVLSPDGRELAWVRYDDSGLTSQLWVGDFKKKKRKFITSGTGFRLSPSWTTDGKALIFTSNQADPNNFELYMVQKDGTCLQRLTFDLAADTLPEPTPDGRRVLFTSNRSGVQQIYLMDLAPPPCSAEEGHL